MITFQVESWQSLSADPDWPLLQQEHWEEFLPVHKGEMPLGLDEALYAEMNRTGRLLVVTARSVGKLVGYCLVFVHRHGHYPTLCGFEDLYFLTATARRGMAGVKLIQATRKVLKWRGCKKVYWMTKDFNSIRTIFARLGMTKEAELWTDKLEDC